MATNGTCKTIAQWEQVAFLLCEIDQQGSVRYRVRVRIGALPPSTTHPLETLEEARALYERAIEVLNQGFQNLVPEALFGHEVSRKN